MGRPYPGHRVAVIDDDGASAARRHRATSRCTGATSTAMPDPVFFLGYWKNADAHRAPSSPATGAAPATSRVDADGYLWYQGRADDMFKAAGYRIGPSEIENCLVKHPAVANAAVVPKPDAERGTSSRPSSCSRRATRASRGARATNCRRTCAASSRPTSTRRRSSSSTRCR